MINNNSSKDEDFSPQYMIDCDTSRNNAGCNGGNFNDAYTFTAENGVVPWENYPYKAKDGRCKQEEMES